MQSENAKLEAAAVCRCVTCPECRGRGHVWFAFGGREYLGAGRSDDLDEMETCEECSGSGIVEMCDHCQMALDEEHQDG